MTPPQGRSPLGKIVVLIPTYNERENLAQIVSRLRAAVPEADVLVLDDSSPDGTGLIADRLAADDSQVRVLHRKGKQGLGTAYLAGFAWGLERGYDVMVEMDADGSHQPEQLPTLLAALSNADLALGSRWVPGGSVVNWPLSRKALSLGGNLYVRVLLGMPIGDATGGFRAFRASTLRTLDLHDVSSQGYCFQVDLAWRAIRAGLRVVEVPITFVERTAGDSKMSQDIVNESLRNITKWGVRYRLGQVRSLTRREPRWHTLQG
ncbi:MAG: dolichol-phosphate mannosyltransferase [Actinomycetota bacterium]|nr:dolichol-phosphate mannosyltransferase [Actinomycetota bacterium]